MKRTCPDLGVCQCTTPACANCDWSEQEARAVRDATRAAGSMSDQGVMDFIEANPMPRRYDPADVANVLRGWVLGVFLGLLVVGLLNAYLPGVTR